MPVREGWIAGFDLADQVLIEESLSLIRNIDTNGVLDGLAPRLTERERASIAAHCAFSHVAVLVSPASVDELIAGLRAQGLEVDEAVPSTVVRDRLSRRHGVSADALEVAIVRLQVADRPVGGLP